MTNSLNKLWIAIPLEMRVIIFLVAFFGGLAAIVSPAKAFDVTTCANGCKTVTGTLQDVLAYEGRAIVKPAHVAKPAHVVKRKTHKPHKALVVSQSQIGWYNVPKTTDNTRVRAEGQGYRVRDSGGTNALANIQAFRKFTNTSQGSGWCYFASIGGVRFIIVSRELWGTPVGFHTQGTSGFKGFESIFK